MTPKQPAGMKSNNINTPIRWKPPPPGRKSRHQQSQPTVLFSSTRWHWTNSFEGCVRLKSLMHKGWSVLCSLLRNLPEGTSHLCTHWVLLKHLCGKIWWSPRLFVLFSTCQPPGDGWKHSLRNRLHQGLLPSGSVWERSAKLRDRIPLLGGDFHRKVGKAPKMVLGVQGDSTG